MKLKSYLRGLGLGIIITTIILVIAFRGRNRQMDDMDVISRAYELGMTETSLYAGNEITTESTTTGSYETEPVTVTEPVTEPTTESVTETVTEPSTERITEPVSNAVTEQATTEMTTEITTAAPKSVTIVFENISSADKASRLLYDAGVIQDIDEFNRYLSENGLATKVGEGTFEFKKNMTFDEIAKIITRAK